MNFYLLLENITALFKSVKKIFKEKEVTFERYQCKAVSSSSAEFNCCIKESGHKGLHMSADGHTWY